ncbi:hypothetical protein MLD38_002770 [Melastoma candidum]|uniref:Uncharacterized protein n=1 Tax=Melastoma candidum TaxID=119954 RepID=A0ACB9S480_9MYRT|nr:hypothetical protein MLD38_002770 [Melastoma candidum]
MEVISYSSASCPCISDSGRKIPCALRPRKLPARGRSKFFLVNFASQHGSARFAIASHFRPNVGVNGSDSLKVVRHPRKSYSRAFGESYSGHVIGDGEVALRASEDGGVIPKVLIPGLPDKSRGEHEASVHSCFWEWKPKFTVHYEKAGCENLESPQMLFLPGFGVGSFHYEKQLKDLGRGYRVWSLDFLGQGKSLPFEDPAPKSRSGKSEEGGDSSWGFGEESEAWASQLVYSMDLWQEQVRHFVEEVIKEPVYVVGNSLGGYVALYFAACYPHLVKGVMLLNATPFWGFLPNPVKSPRFARIFPWAGTFPLPSGVRKLTEIVWEKISDPKSIAEVLRQVYADHTINVDKVFSRILETTQHPAAAASFASIMFAPQGELSFGDSLSMCKINNVPICLVYGKEDPWVKPIWGRQIKRQIPEAPYYEISPAGHCPHDEVPEVVNHLLRGWIKNLESRGSASLPLIDDPQNLDRNIDRDMEFIRGGKKKVVRVRFVGSTALVWERLGSFISSRLGKLKLGG